MEVVVTAMHNLIYRAAEEGIVEYKDRRSAASIQEYSTDVVFLTFFSGF